MNDEVVTLTLDNILALVEFGILEGPVEELISAIESTSGTNLVVLGSALPKGITVNWVAAIRAYGLNRNDPCPCGSGKAVKSCHGRKRRRRRRR